LADQGYTVYAPRIAGHGTNPYDLARMRWQDWFASALDAYQVLRQQCDQVFVCGLSMGGVLALLLSATEKVDGVIALAAPMMLKRPLEPNYLRLAKYIVRYTNQGDQTDFPKYVIEQQQLRGETPIGRVRYNLWPTAAVEQLALLIQHTAGQLHQVKAPLLLVYSEGDVTVGLESQARIVQGVRSVDKQVMILKASGHILTQDREHAVVFERVTEFIRQRTTFSHQNP
jgi:carboxylesterase